MVPVELRIPEPPRVPVPAPFVAREIPPLAVTVLWILITPLPLVVASDSAPVFAPPMLTLEVVVMLAPEVIDSELSEAALLIVRAVCRACVKITLPEPVETVRGETPKLTAMGP